MVRRKASKVGNLDSQHVHHKGWSVVILRIHLKAQSLGDVLILPPRRRYRCCQLAMQNFSLVLFLFSVLLFGYIDKCSRILLFIQGHM